MKVQIEEISPIKKKLVFEVPEEDLKKALNKAYQKLQGKVVVKGFRKGKVPRSLLEKSYGAQTQMETVSDLIDQSYKNAIQQHGIIAVDLPKISDLKIEENKPITFTAEVDVQPKVVAADFLGIKLEKNKVEVAEEELEAELKALQKAHAQRGPIDESQTAQAGHFGTIDFIGTIDGVPFEGGSGKGVAVELGAGRFLPEFEQGILGMRQGENREIEVNFPLDYGHEPLRGKLAKFQIHLIDIKQEILPNLDDEFAKDLGTFETLDQVKANLKEHMLKSKESQEKGQLFTQILEHLVAKNSFDVPPTMIDRELEYMLKGVHDQLASQGLSLEKVGMNEADYRSRNRPEALRRIQGFLLFDSIAEQNQLQVQEEELDQRLQGIAQRYKQPVEAIRRHYIEKNLIRPLYNQILEEKTLDFLISQAKISEKKVKKGETS